MEAKGGLAGWLPEDTMNYAIPNNVNGVGNGFTDFIWDTASAPGGHGSLLFKGKGIRVPMKEKRIPDVLDRIYSMKVPMKGNTVYRVRYQYRADGLSTQDTVYCIAIIHLNFAGGPFLAGYMGRIGFIPDKSNPSLVIPNRPTDTVLPDNTVHESIIRQNADTWTAGEFEVTTPPGTTKGALTLGMNCNMPAHPFSVWFDNLSIAPVAADNAATVEVPTDWTARTLPPRTTHDFETGEPPLLPPAMPYGSRLQRTMKLLATSTPEHHHHVRILCYGQSIMALPWWYKIYGELKRKYPYADLEMDNLSIGGFMAEQSCHRRGASMIVARVQPGNMGVSLCHIRRAMPQYLLQVRRTPAVPHIMERERMAELMQVQPDDTRAFRPNPHERLDALVTERFAPTGHPERVVRAVPPRGEIFQQRLARGRRKGNHTPFTALAPPDGQPHRREIDIGYL